jgi:hypothetical protein
MFRRSTSKLLFAAMLLAGLSAACGAPAGTQPPAAAPAATQAPVPVSGVAADAVQLTPRLIIRNGNISMSVSDPRAAKEAVEQVVAEMAGEGAFIVSSDERGGTDDRPPQINMVVRVPAARFDEVMDRLAALAVEVIARNESSQDVTEEYVDLQARLESLEAARQRLLDIMRNAQTTEDVLAAEQQLTQREAEIESLKGRLQYLEQSARLSSISLELRPHILGQPLDTRWRPAETARRAFDTLVSSLRGVGDFLIFFGIACLPWLVPIGLVLYSVRRLFLWRRARRRREKLAPTSPPEP